MAFAHTRSNKIPKSWPTFIVKAIWDSTAIFLKFEAKDDDDAIERAWKRMRKTEGGDKCVDVKIMRRT